MYTFEMKTYSLNHYNKNMSVSIIERIFGRKAMVKVSFYVTRRFSMKQNILINL